MNPVRTHSSRTSHRCRSALTLLILITWIAAACSNRTSQPDVAPTPRSDLYFGYYGDCPTCLEETLDHVSFTWIAGWGRPGHVVDEIIERAKAANAANMPTVIMLPGMYKDKRLNRPALDAARAIFGALHNAQALDNVVAIYPQDEPEQLGLSDKAVKEANAAVRSVMSEFDQLTNTPLAVIYSAGGARPGLSDYDWVGIDGYDQGVGVLGKPYRTLKAKLRDDQRILLVPGGASPWKQDPERFFLRAYEDPQVVGIVTFIWFDNAAINVGAGVRSNGLADDYRTWALRR